MRAKSRNASYVKCAICGARCTPELDHIYPAMMPHLRAYDFKALCGPCNRSKSAKYHPSCDYRTKSAELSIDAVGKHAGPGAALALAIMLSTGCRLRSVVALDWCDVYASGDLFVVDSKSAAVHARFTGEQAEYMSRLWLRCAREYAPAGHIAWFMGPLFCKYNKHGRRIAGARVTPDAIYSRIMRAFPEAGSGFDAVKVINPTRLVREVQSIDWSAGVARYLVVEAAA